MKIKQANLSVNRAFTLIELLIVVAIIALLAGVILVSTSISQQKAKTAATLSTLASLRSAVANCCTKSSNTLMSGTPTVLVAGTRVCLSDATSQLFPTAAQLNATSVTVWASNCDQVSPAYGVRLSGHPNPACNGDASNYFRISETQVEKFGTVLNCK